MATDYCSTSQIGMNDYISMFIYIVRVCVLERICIVLKVFESLSESIFRGGAIVSDSFTFSGTSNEYNVHMLSAKISRNLPFLIKQKDDNEYNLTIIYMSHTLHLELSRFF